MDDTTLVSSYRKIFSSTDSVPCFFMVREHSCKRNQKPALSFEEMLRFCKEIQRALHCMTPGLIDSPVLDSIERFAVAMGCCHHGGSRALAEATVDKLRRVAKTCWVPELLKLEGLVSGKRRLDCPDEDHRRGRRRISCESQLKSGRQDATPDTETSTAEDGLLHIDSADTSTFLSREETPAQMPSPFASHDEVINDQSSLAPTAQSDLSITGALDLHKDEDFYLYPNRTSGNVVTSIEGSYATQEQKHDSNEGSVEVQTTSPPAIPAMEVVATTPLASQTFPQTSSDNLPNAKMPDFPDLTFDIMDNNILFLPDLEFDEHFDSALVDCLLQHSRDSGEQNPPLPFLGVNNLPQQDCQTTQQAHGLPLQDECTLALDGPSSIEDNAKNVVRTPEQLQLPVRSTSDTPRMPEVAAAQVVGDSDAILTSVPVSDLGIANQRNNVQHSPSRPWAGPSSESAMQFNVGPVPLDGGRSTITEERRLAHRGDANPQSNTVKGLQLPGRSAAEPSPRGSASSRQPLAAAFRNCLPSVLGRVAPAERGSCRPGAISARQCDGKIHLRSLPWHY
ncbi:hypothetical protein Slin15195_G129620 [Septoria linicola]|uniref:Uncharacterized protein n=1 Tax=Septoria linicola TaxID=215465 RepID=A0A9Q9ESI8_9PEZI|nr:hypothetical protein Slin15195_G129620 [Septoria linicola]